MMVLIAGSWRAWERVLNRFRGPGANETGAVAAEYAILLTLIALAIIAGTTLLGNELGTIFQNACNTIAGLAGGTC